MIARWPGKRRIKRQFKRSTLLALRVATRHYMSVLSLGVLAGALMLAITHNPLDARAPAASAPVAEVLPDATTSPPAQVAVPSNRPTVVYYFIDSLSARNEIEMALHRDLTDEALQDYAPLHGVSRIFVMIEDARDEAEALEFLRQLVISPPVDGTLVKVVDLR